MPGYQRGTCRTGTGGALTTLVRFSSLGDVVLAGSISKALGGVNFVTKARYAGLVERFEGVERVIALERDGALATLRRTIPPGPVIDLHGSTRSRLLGADRRVRSHRLARWARVALKRRSPVPTVLERYGAAAGVSPAHPPWCSLPGGDRGRSLGIAGGASVSTKIWSGWEALAEAWEGPTLSFGLPGESVPGTEAVLERGFEETLAGFARCSLFVGGDTGLTHLAQACGIPTLMVMGPTHPDDGFWCGPVVALDLPCRPCSRHGRPSCPIGDHACLEGLSVERVLRSLKALAGAQ